VTTTRKGFSSRIKVTNQIRMNGWNHKKINHQKTACA